MRDEIPLSEKRGDIILRPTAVYHGEKLGNYYSIYIEPADVFEKVNKTKVVQAKAGEVPAHNYSYPVSLPVGAQD